MLEAIGGGKAAADSLPRRGQPVVARICSAKEQPVVARTYTAREQPVVARTYTAREQPFVARIWVQHLPAPTVCTPCLAYPTGASCQEGVTFHNRSTLPCAYSLCPVPCW